MNKTAAIVVLFNPVGVDTTIGTISAQVDFCLLVDNTPNAEATSWQQQNNIHSVHLGENYGVAYAQNYGLDKAKALGADYVVFFDQDSDVPEEYVPQMVNSYDKLRSLDVNVGLIAARAFNKYTGTTYRHRDKSNLKNIRSIINRYSEVEYTLSSGSFVKLDVFEEVGLFHAPLFIDSVDHEFCWRLSTCGYKVLIDEELKLPHMLGEKRRDNTFVTVNVPAPIRHYYVFRNWIHLCKQKHVPYQFKTRTLLRMPLKATYFICFESPRRQRLKYIAKGVWHGLIGKLGRYPSSK
nr:glycosyltransferase family 2 protein [Neiella litorisoli]